MTTLYVVLFLLSAVCFLLAAFSVPVQKINILALGLFFWVMVPLIIALQSL